MAYYVVDSDHLSHYGVPGQQWGVRNAEWYPIANWEAHMRNARSSAEGSRELIETHKEQLVERQAALKEHKSKDTSNYGSIRKALYDRKTRKLNESIASAKNSLKAEKERLKDYENRIKEGHAGIVAKNDVDYMKAHPDEFTDAEINQAINRYGLESRLKDIDSRPKETGLSENQVKVEKAIRDGDLSYMASHKSDFSNDEIRKVVERYNLNTSVNDLVKKEADKSKAKTEAGDSQQIQKKPVDINAAIDKATNVINTANKAVNAYNLAVPLINGLAGTDLKKFGAQTGDITKSIKETFQDGRLTRKETTVKTEKGVDKTTYENFSKPKQESSEKTTTKTEKEDKSATKETKAKTEKSEESSKWTVDENYSRGTKSDSSQSTSSKSNKETIIDGVFREVSSETIWPTPVRTALANPVSNYSSSPTREVSGYLEQRQTFLLEDFSKRK